MAHFISQDVYLDFAILQRTMSDNVNDPAPLPKPDVASQDVLVRKEEVREIVLSP